MCSGLVSIYDDIRLNSLLLAMIQVGMFVYLSTLVVDCMVDQKVIMKNEFFVKDKTFL